MIISSNSNLSVSNLYHHQRTSSSSHPITEYIDANEMLCTYRLPKLESKIGTSLKVGDNHSRNDSSTLASAVVSGDALGLGARPDELARLEPEQRALFGTSGDVWQPKDKQREGRGRRRSTSTETASHGESF